MTAGRFLLRLLLVPAALVLALLAGAAVAGIAYFRVTIPDFSASDLDFAVQGLVFSVLPLLFYLGPFFFGLALIAATLAEALSIRSWIFHAGAGALIAVGLSRYLGLTGPFGLIGDEAALAAGLAAGLTYWLFAGRSAGAEPARPPA